MDGTVGVQVAVRLPGEVESNAPAQSAGRARWELRLRDRVDLTAQSSAWNVANLVGTGVAGLAVVGLLALLLTRRREQGPTRRRR